MKQRISILAFTFAFLGILMPTNSMAENYDIVTITVQASAYDASKPPQFAKVKYNKLCPLITTSDDMGAGELIRNWAFFNGYPVFANDAYGQIAMGNDFLDSPYSASAWAQQVRSLKRDSHSPLTYSDNTGGVRRFTGTSAIWPHQVNNTNSTLINGNDAKVMIRTGWSFAQHDVDYSENDIKAGLYTAQQVADRFQPLSELWAENATGIGLKVMVEPSGAHTYIDAGKLSDEICWNIFQNGVVGTYPEMTHTLVNDWTSGTDWTTFGTNKPTETTRRIFFQGHENEWFNAINSADGTEILIGGTHGIGDDILAFMKNTVQPTDQFWVASADEVWEYYHLYNNATIQNLNYADGTLTFQVKVPKYQKSQFRELTINIPGITNGSNPTYSNNVIVGGARQNNGQYTINIGLEDKIYTYIEELIAYYRAHQYNTYVKDDAQYLIDLLLPGTKKDDYQSQLDAAAVFTTYQVTTSVGEKVLAAGGQDAAAAVTYTFPKYLLSGTDLYQATKNGSKPYYVTTFTPNSGTDNRTVTYTKAVENVTFFAEGENLDGAFFNPKSMGNINDNGKGEYLPWHEASNAAGGYITSPVTVTTVQPGKYNLVVACGDSFNNATHYATFTFKLGDKTIFTFQTDYQGIKEYTKEAILVKEPMTLTVEAIESGTSRWIDYLYLVKTAEYDATVPDVEISAATTDLDITDGVSPVTITATATGYEGAAIAQTVIKDADGNTLATNSGSTCQYSFTPTQLGNIIFTAEATDNQNRTGASQDLTITVKSDFTLTAVSNMGDPIANTTFTAQTDNKNYSFLYPRYLLKGTTLYETAARSADSRQLHYGENVTFSLANKNIERTIDYTAAVANIVFFTEGEDVTGARKWTNNKFDSGQGQSYALTLGSMGACGGFKSEGQGSNTLTTLPAGQYQLTAIIGCTNSTSTYTFKAGNTPIGSYNATPSTASLVTYTTDPFTLDGETTVTAASSIGPDNSQNWIDLVYIKKLDAQPVTVGTQGYATFSSLYSLDFTSVSGIKAYIATSATNGAVDMTQVTGTVPEATGLLLQATIGSTTSTTIPLATTVPTTITNNLLLAHTEEGEVAAGNYVFSGKKDGTELGFRQLSEPTNVPAGRAYLTLPDGSPARLSITFDNLPATIGPLHTGNATEANLQIYNLNGQKSGWHKGIIISNGRKYIK
jgi:hypothetical protein